MATMQSTPNPYRPPEQPDHPSDDALGFARLRGLWRALFWIGVGCLVIGLIAFFTPNLPPLGLLLIAVIAFGIDCLFSREYRRRSSIALMLCLLLGTFVVIHHRRQLAEFQLMRAREAQARAMEAIARLEAEMQAQAERAKAELERARESASDPARPIQVADHAQVTG